VQAVSWLLASAAVHFMGYDALHACMEHLSTFIYACMDVKIVGNQSSCMGGMERERERESAWTLVVYMGMQVGWILTRLVHGLRGKGGGELGYPLPAHVADAQQPDNFL
jgi:hypothetical protein